MKTTLVLIAFLFAATLAYPQTSFIDSLQRLVASHPRDTNEIRALDLLVGEFKRKDMDKAMAYGYQQMALAKALGNDFGLSSAYSGFVTLHQDTGRPDSAQYYLTLMEALVKNKSRDRKALINYYSTAGLFYKNQGKSKEAIPYLLEALRIIGANGDKTRYAGQHINIGNAYYDQGDLKNAVAYHLKALALFDELKNKRGQAYCLQNLGSDFFVLGQYSTSEKYLFQAQKLKEELGDKRGMLATWMTLGSVYQQTGKFELAMSFFNKTLALARELKLRLEESRALFNKGSLLKTLKKNDESDKTFLEALLLARQCGDSVLVSRIKTYRVMLQNDVQKEKNEEQTLLQNIRITREQGSLSNTAEGHFELADWYASHKVFEKAFDNLKQGQQIKDSVSGNQVIMQLKKMEEEYKNEKKEKELILLRKEQELKTLALSRQRLIITSVVIALIAVIIVGLLLVNRYRTVNKTKRQIEIERVRNNIARDLHDDIGSALSSINILSQVALHEQNANVQSYLQRIGDQSTRTLEDMGDIVWSINPRNDQMSQIIIRMREFAAEILDSKNISYHFEENVSGELMLNADKRKNLFLIFKESVNNASKYSHAQQIEISLHQHDHTLLMRVKDNGQGFDEHTAKRGNGLRNLHERAKEMNGTVTLKTATGQGTEVELLLPLA